MRLYDVRRTFVEFTVSHFHLERHCDVVQNCILCARIFFPRLPNGQYGPVSQLSRSEKCCTGHLIGAKPIVQVKR